MLELKRGSPSNVKGLLHLLTISYKKSNMSSLDLENLLTEVSPDSPAGADLEYDPVFGEIERAAEGTQEQSLGDSTIAGIPPDWKAVRNNSVKLFSQTKDLRIAVLLARALLCTDGIIGFGEGIALIRGMLENWWSTLHPELDPDDDNDPTFRINTLLTLCDREATLRVLLHSPLVSSKALGQYSLGDIQVAKGELPPSDKDDQAPDMTTISAAFMDCSIDQLKSTAEALAGCRRDIDAIDAFLMENVGSKRAPDLSALSDTLKRAAAIVNSNLEKRGEAAGAAPDDPEDIGRGETKAAPQAITGEILSREDAARMMDKITEYFRRAEPSSPVPLLMQRAKRLSNLGFMEILKDIAPDGLKQAQNIGGMDSAN